VSERLLAGLFLLTLPRTERFGPVSAFPFLELAVLVVNPDVGEEACGHPPFDRSPDPSGVAEAVGIASADQVARVVQALNDGSAHARIVRRRKILATVAAAPMATAKAAAIAFVWMQVRHALQQVAAIGACSPYFALACVSRPLQFVFTSQSVRRAGAA
jgi:hypothetical protein